MIKSSKNSDNVRYAVRDIILVADQARQKGLKLNYLNIGDPIDYGFATPPHMVEAVYKAMLDGQTGYSPSSGSEEAIESIRAEAGRKGIREIRDIFITHGASEAIELVLTALLDPGDNVLTPSPGYPLYTAVLAKIGVKENPYYLDEDNMWQPDPDDIRRRINSKTKAIVIINPNNPTGSICSSEIMQEIIKIAEENELLILADEIYDKILYDGLKHISIASLCPHLPVFTFNGVSKSYVAPGYRMGWGIASGPLDKMCNIIESVNRLLRARICVCTPIMASVKAALEGPQDHFKSYMEKLTARRDITYKMLNETEGMSCVKPQGAFYAFPRLHNIQDDKDFVYKLILETGVIVVHGSGFGQKKGTHHLRVVFLAEEDVLRDSYGKIGGFLKKYLGGCVKK